MAAPMKLPCAAWWAALWWSRASFRSWRISSWKYTNGHCVTLGKHTLNILTQKNYITFQERYISKLHLWLEFSDMKHGKHMRFCACAFCTRLYFCVFVMCIPKSAMRQHKGRAFVCQAGRPVSNMAWFICLRKLNQCVINLSDQCCRVVYQWHCHVLMFCDNACKRP